MDGMKIAIGYHEEDRFHENTLYFVDDVLVTHERFMEAARELAPDYFALVD